MIEVFFYLGKCCVLMRWLRCLLYPNVCPHWKMSLSSCLGYLQIWENNYQSGYCMYFLLQNSSAHDNWKKRKTTELPISHNFEIFCTHVCKCASLKNRSCDWAVARFIQCLQPCVISHYRDLELIPKPSKGSELCLNTKRTVLIYWWLLKLVCR